MSKWIALLLVGILLPGVAQAQGEIIDNYSPTDFETTLKEDLKKNFEKQKGSVYEIRDTPYLAFFNPKGKFVLFFAHLPKNAFNQEVTAKKIDGWNRDAIYSRAYLSANGEVLVYEGTLSFAAGVSRGQVKSFYDHFDKEFDRFLKDLGGLKENHQAKVGGKTGPVEVVRQGFPAHEFDEEKGDLGKSDTGWEIAWDFAPVGNKKVFRIVSAKFSWKDAKGNPRSMIVARNMQLVEAFTQYDDGKTSWLDIAKVGLNIVPGNEKFLGPSCVGAGKLLESKIPEFNRKVYKELHYDGLRWMSVYQGYRAQKGEKLSLWSAIASGNYVYMMEYDFTDDGRIVCRLGFTAHNFFDRAKVPGSIYGFRQANEDVHAHLGCWRFDFDLGDPMHKVGGPSRNELKLVRRVFENGKFRLDVLPFPGDKKAVQDNEAHEGKAKWIAKNFTMLRAESLDMKNSRGQPIAYDLVSTRTGTAEDLMPIHQAKGANMDFVNYDFWAIRTPKNFHHYYQLPDIAKDQPLTNQPMTVWHSVPGLHVPRDEDFGAGGMNAARGVALTEWIGFTLRPRNLFDSTPSFKNKD